MGKAKTTLSLVEHYTFKTNKWIALPSMHSPRTMGGSCCFKGGLLLQFGGFANYFLDML